MVKDSRFSKIYFHGIQREEIVPVLYKETHEPIFNLAYFFNVASLTVSQLAVYLPVDAIPTQASFLLQAGGKMTAIAPWPLEYYK